MKEKTYIKISLCLLTLVFMFGGITTSTLAFQDPGKAKGDKSGIQKPGFLQKDSYHQELPEVLPALWEASKAPGSWHKSFFRLDIGGPYATKEDVAEAVQQYLLNNPDLLAGFDSTNGLKLTYTATVRDMVYVQFVQVIPAERIEVSETYVNFSVKNLEDKCVVMALKANLYPDVSTQLPAKNNLSILTLRDKAAKALNLSPATATLLKEREIIRYLNGRWLRLYEANFKEAGYTAVVNSDTGSILGKRDDRLYYNYSGRVQGRGVRFDPIATGDALPALDHSDLKITASDGTVTYTNITGNFAFSSPILLPLVTAELLGRWSDVHSEAGADLSFGGTATPGVPFNVLFNPGTQADEYPTAQVNGYYHTTFIHNWVKGRLGGNLPGIDAILPVNVNVNDTCNANYDYSSINFFKAGGGCLNTAYDTVIYHEYGHFVDNMAGGIPQTDTGIGLSEGWGDVLGSYASGQPLLGEGFYGAGTYIRTADNNRQYPLHGIDGLGNLHHLGEAWAGFAWHLRQNLINSYGASAGIALAEQLIIPTFLANSVDIPSAVMDVLFLDDNDTDISNGTPHMPEIINAAQQHALFPFFEESIAYISSPAANSSVPTGQTVTISGTASGSAFQNYQLFYGAGLSPQTWAPITPVMTSPVANGELAAWDTTNLPPGICNLKLLVTMQGGMQFQYIDFISVELPVIRITTNPDHHENPSISGDKIVYEDYDYHYDNWDTYLYDLATGTEYRITTNPDSQISPSISGDRIAWQDNRNGNWDIYLYDLATGTESQITTNSHDQILPSISGDRIAWQDNRNGNWDIYLYDLATGTESQITTNSYDQILPSISGDRIAWQDNRNGNWDIYLYDLATGTESQITTNSYDQILPSISGNRIVWEDYRNDEIDIYLYDLTTHTESRLTTNLSDQRNPSISGNKIAYEDNRNNRNSSNWDIYLYDLATHTESQITTNPSYQGSAAISGDKIVWGDYRNGNPDIYLTYDPTYYLALVKNYSFEIDAGIDFYSQWNVDNAIGFDLVPDGWFTDMNFYTAQMDNTTAYQSANSIKIARDLQYNVQAFAGQDIPIEHGKAYRVSGYVATDCGNAACYGTITSECMDNSHGHIWTNCGLNLPEAQWIKLYGNNNWRRVQFYVNADNQQAAFLRVLCYNTPMPHQSGIGTIWCDSINVEEFEARPPCHGPKCLPMQQEGGKGGEE